MGKRPLWETRAGLARECEGLRSEVIVERERANNWERAHGLLFNLLVERDRLAKEEAPTEHELRERERNLSHREACIEALADRLHAKEFALAQLEALGTADNELLKRAGLPPDPTTPQSYGGGV